MRKSSVGVLGGLMVSGVVGGGAVAHAQNASLTVYLRAAGSGTFNKTNSISTQVNVFAVSSVAAKYNSGTNLYAPTSLAPPGTAFNQVVPNLYSPVLAPSNSYQVRLTWTDTADPDLPDRSTQLYVYWSGVLLGNAKDLDRTELHMSTNAGFSPSAATLVAKPPYGTDFRKLSGLKPATDYYFCVRVIDN